MLFFHRSFIAIFQFNVLVIAAMASKKAKSLYDYTGNTEQRQLSFKKVFTKSVALIELGPIPLMFLFCSFNSFLFGWICIMSNKYDWKELTSRDL